jgi:hypothetical protein
MSHSHPRAEHLFNGLSYVLFSPGGTGGGGATGLYSTIGLVGLLTGLLSVFFGFFFSLPRLSRLPMNRSFPSVIWLHLPASLLYC